MKKRYDWKVTVHFVASAVGQTKKQSDAAIKGDVINLLTKHLRETKKSKCFKIDRVWKHGKEENETKHRR
tara:strand:- start:287 stop:496 length:210 start_codon:yes stop_codon:yes gene_type:complete